MKPKDKRLVNFTMKGSGFSITQTWTYTYKHKLIPLIQVHYKIMYLMLLNISDSYNVCQDMKIKE